MKLFEAVGQGFFGTLLLVLSIHVLWFFGIHGSNMLEAVTQRIFENGLAVNQALEAAGQTPTEIYTKSFLDTFVMMGGCGTCLCLVIAVLVAGRQPSNRRLAKLAAAPVLFNINELMVFGLPLVLNPTLLIPFLLVPLMATCTSSPGGGAGTGAGDHPRGTVDGTGHPQRLRGHRFGGGQRPAGGEHRAGSAYLSALCAAAGDQAAGGLAGKR